METRMEHLAEANRCRIGKKDARLRAKAGASVAAIIAAMPKECRGARAAEVLTWIPGVGKTKAANICRSLRITSTRRLDSLHPLERNRLAERAGEYEQERADRLERHAGRLVATIA